MDMYSQQGMEMKPSEEELVPFRVGNPILKAVLQKRRERLCVKNLCLKHGQSFTKYFINVNGEKGRVEFLLSTLVAIYLFFSSSLIHGSHSRWPQETVKLAAPARPPAQAAQCPSVR